MSKLILLAGLALLCVPADAIAKSSSHTIKIENMQFAPANESLAAGDLLVWENKDLVPHTVTAEDGSFDSKLIEPGKSWKHQIKKKGSVAYKCLFHPTMKANLTVK